jgi:inner membrane protein
MAGVLVYLVTGPDSPRRRTCLLLWAVAFAIAPDLDVVPGLLLAQPALFHQGISHSIGFAIAAGLVGAASFRMKGEAALSGFLLAACAYASHLLLDLFGPDRRLPYGIPLFWPLSLETYLSPVELLPGMRHAATTDATTLEWLRGIFAWHNVRALVVEALILGPCVLLALWLKRMRRPT